MKRRSVYAVVAIVALVTSSVFALIGGSPAGAVVAPAAGAYVPITPANLLDTTTGSPVAPHANVNVVVNGRAGIPADASAVALNLIVVSPPVAGFATVFPAQTVRPGTSNIDFTPHQRIANLVITKTNGSSISIYNGSTGATHFVVNAVGYYAGGASPVAGGFQPVTPANFLDTGTGVGVPAGLVAPHAAVTVQVAGRAGVAASNVSAVAINVAYVAPTRSGFGVVYPSDLAMPGTSNIDFVATQTIANMVITKLSAGGAITLYNGSSGTVRIEANVFGYYVGGGSPTDGGALVPLAPVNILDTGNGIGAPAGPVAPHAIVTFQVTGRGGVPASGVSAAVLDLAIVAPTSGGYATAYAADIARPPAATMNFTPNRTIASLAITQVSAAGAISVYNGSAGTVRIEANILGYTLATPPGPVTGVTAAASFTSVKLNWTNPASASLAGVLIRRDVGSNPPAAPNAGALVADLDAPTATFTDTGLTAGTVYSYSLFSHDATNDFGPLATATASTSPEITWGTPVAFDSTTYGSFVSVSCPTTTFCGALTSKSNWTTFNGSTWTTPAAIGMPTVAVSCDSATFCLAVGNPASNVVARTFNGSSWSGPTTVDAAHQPLAVSCGSPTFCMVAETTGFAVPILNGIGGTPVMVDSVNLSSLSCLTRTFCAAVDQNGRALKYDGTTWTPAAAIGAYGSACPANCAQMRIDCTSTTFCLLVAPNSSAATFNGTTWTLRPSGSSLSAASCASATFCVGVGGGTSKTFDGSSFDAPQPVGSSADATSVSCVTKTFCVAVGGSHAVLGT